ncbi:MULTISPECIES: VOC family protein [unclassified Sphingobium]|uniref:VOC family protein n=1 Tax=unclassified Sphingobium TaxID=2611147 RepID=UPI00222556D6|nr:MULTISPECIES: VOC family protein [unclassified Sphingobium]MCW2394025.1 catechol 2,3-dioxygenase-like lactoylglutathione lyase family enzyme [Sphingobium sp. B8D3B]MCW2417539.1 catechol 2,3-dioxygenase-like lactoylglutathione lyase family enzyme [Sphingobium sp. B8D3C]
MALSGLHHIHLTSRELDKALAFMADFGLVLDTQVDGVHYLRAAGAAAYQVVLERGDTDQLIAVALETDSEADLVRLSARASGSAPQALEGPGGGQFVELTDPDGKTIRLVHGIARREAEAARTPMVVNYGTHKARMGSSQSFAEIGPAQLLRMGHVGLFVRDMKACDAWYRDVLGLLPSDLMHAGPPENIVAGFYRIDRGDEWVDHHTIALFGFGKSDLHHISFEVADSESQFMAHRWMTRQQHEPIWGVGRHPRGSHVFDVWRAPGGYRFETFTDTDMLNASAVADLLPIEKMEMDLWCDRSHETYFS